MENYTVYMHTCPNGKRYIGITRRNPRRRWGSKGTPYREHNKHFYSAIELYGCCNGKLQKIKGYVFRWSGEPFDKYYTGRLSNDKRTVRQIDLNGNTVAIYSSCADAERATGIPNTNIVKVCKGNTGRKKAGGYYWKYEGVV